MTERGKYTGKNEWACLTTGEETGREKEGKGGVADIIYFIRL